MRKIALALALLVGMVGAAEAQCNGVFPAATVCGTILGGPPGPVTSPVSPGVDGNVLNTQTSTYAAISSDCGKTITLGGNAFYTLTFGAAATFPATCSVVIANIDSGRGKKITINGVTFPNNSILWPLQTFTLKNENNSWTVVNSPDRWRLQGSAAFFVDAAAVDNSSDGLAIGAANAFKTITGAISILSQVLDANQQAVTLTPKCAGTTYTENPTLLPIVGAYVSGGLGANNPTLIGDTTTPSNCVLNGQLLALGSVNDWIIRGFQFQNAGGICVLADAASWIRFGEVNFNVCSGQHIQVENGSTVEMMANYTISGGAPQHVLTTNFSHFLAVGVTITTGGTPAFSSQFTASTRNSTQVWSGTTFAGSGATGARFLATLGGGIETGLGTCVTSSTYFPGNSNGTITAPGWCD